MKVEVGKLGEGSRPPSSSINSTTDGANTLVEGGNTSGTQHTTRMLRSSAAQPMEDQNKGLGGIHQQAVVLLSGGDMDAS